MSDLPKRLRASIGMGAINGGSFERNVCEMQMREAADLIEQQQLRIDELRQHITELEAQLPKRISVDDRLPEKGVLVLVFSPKQDGDWDDDGSIDFDFLDPDTDEPSWYNHNGHYEHYCAVALPGGSVGPKESAPYTHWMPIPQPPKDRDNE